MNKIFGYYICEKISVPDFLGIKSDEMITVSNCFTDLHPALSYCYFDNNRKAERMEYHKKWALTEAKAAMLQDEIHSMFERCLAIDGRFSNIEDAKRIREKYFDENKCVIVSVSTTEEYYKILTEELSENSSGINNFFPGVLDENQLLGYDILGWDISGFHTFLCNSLHKELEMPRFNQYCLLENDFETIQDFAKQIQGKGEPVEWIPCRIGIEKLFKPVGIHVAV